MTAQKRKTGFHIPSLDGMRAVSITLVYVAHAGLGHVVPGGFGVTVFFFLSGFLISTLLRREYEERRRISFKNFYMRRVLRIFPPFYSALSLSVVMVTVGLLPGTVDWRGVAWIAGHMANYLQVYGHADWMPPGTGVYWSLAVEEHYYLTYPLLAYYLLKKGDRRLSALVLFGVGLLVLGWRAYLMSHGAASSRAYLSSDTRIDSILWGCLLALCCNPVLDPPVKAGRLAKLGVLGLSGAVLLSTFVYRDPFFRQTYRYTLQGLALLPAFYLAVSEARWGVFRWLGYAPVRHFGVLSYTFYLVHHLMLYSAEHLAAELNQVLRGGLVFVLALVYSELSLRYLERPIARLRAHYR